MIQVRVVAPTVIRTFQMGPDTIDVTGAFALWNTQAGP